MSTVHFTIPASATVEGNTFEGDTFDLVIDGMTFAEARAFEKTSGVGFQEMLAHPELRVNVDVLQALLWVSMKRKQPTLTYSDLDDIAIDGIDWTDDDAAAKKEESEGDQARDPFAETDDGVEATAS